MQIKKVVLPETSMLINNPNDYRDSYCGQIDLQDKTITIDQVGNAFFVSSPKWIGLLLSFRNKIVSLFGLKTGHSISKEKKLIIEKGEQIGLFKIFDKTENEIILGEDDKHLDFRVSLFLDSHTQHKKKLIISTIVVFNNWFGKVYFLPVKPFHKVIVRNMLKNTIQELKY